ncbi:membrane protein DedA, SNARE-associated domain [Saccharopolyspora antimicrobica]|uniref:Membrane protein DedA with SNARE-associated domain n=1 Tax=Saccharopolyspora antimicrobica TaxID=455193 RepID=A0A1I5G7C4_9PSEU|nr:DedA family protein [Saccharopolyspora antimicrobica]RKT83890.1 membrane protein DedA with SNARE-associated domain [Saccharopolyspora antimicrobica]SFO31940.1 membrane protein DedA, SNARE-associated domain [Saccharopolyspora antimicrobica]
MDLTTLAATSAEPTGFTGWVISVMEALGSPGAGAIVALENLFPPIPSEVILPLAGFAASQGNMTLIGAILWTTLGSLVGALALYGIGATLGRDRTRAIAAKLPLVKISDIDRTEAWFAKHGVKAVFFGRMIPLFRSFISLPAGVERMRLSTFALFTTLGSLIWNTVFVVAGYLLGESWYLVEEYAGVFSKVVLVLAVLAVVAFIAVRIRNNRRGGPAAAQAEEAPTVQFARVSAEAPTEEIRRLR